MNYLRREYYDVDGSLDVTAIAILPNFREDIFKALVANGWSEEDARELLSEGYCTRSGELCEYIIDEIEDWS